MEPVNYTRDGEAREGVSTEWFVGEPVLRDLSGVLEMDESRVYHVTFSNNARTKLHYHHGGQLLIVTGGTGSLVVFRKLDDGGSEFRIKEERSIELRRGSIQYIPARTLHTHGSINEGTLSHIAINYPGTGTDEGYETVWYESDFKHRVTKRL